MKILILSLCIFTTTTVFARSRATTTYTMYHNKGNATCTNCSDSPSVAKARATTTYTMYHNKGNATCTNCSDSLAVTRGGTVGKTKIIKLNFKKADKVPDKK